MPGACLLLIITLSLAFYRVVLLVIALESYKEGIQRSTPLLICSRFQFSYMPALS